MNLIDKTVFLLLRLAVHGKREELDVVAKVNWEQVDWSQIYDAAKAQGVAAIVFDGVLMLHQHQAEATSALSRNLKIRWASITNQIEQYYNRQFERSAELAALYSSEGIPTYVLKGMAISVYYPIPSHRECGDLDCFLGADYERGNVIAEKHGAEVHRDFYKHSHIKYRGLMVENHQFCTAIRGGGKDFERHLQGLLKQDAVEYIGDSRLIKPSADFNALFLTAHGLGHFLSEGIKLRHILDWALLLKAEQNNIDWEEFYKWTDRMNMTRFADALTAISVEHLGLEITNPAIHTTSPYAERILHDTLYSSEGVFNKKASAWTKRLMLVRNKFSYGWKYHKIYQKSILVELTRSVFAFLFEKNPKL